MSLVEIVSLPFRILYKVHCILFFSVSLVLLYPIFKILLAKPARYPGAFRMMRFYAWLFHFFLIIPVRVRSKPKKLPEGAFIICPNHSSFFDIPCIYLIFKNYFTFVGKKEIEKWPLFRIFYTSGMNILVDRHSTSGAVKAMRRMMAEVEMNHPLMIFPEGTITKNAPHMGPFRPGAFQIAIQKQIPVVPVTFLNNYKRLERKGFLRGYASPGICNVIIHDPVSTKGLTKDDLPEFEKRIRDIIEKPILDELKKSKKKPVETNVLSLAENGDFKKKSENYSRL